MKRQKTILLVVAQVVAVFMLNTQAPAWIHTTSLTYGCFTGELNPGSVSTFQDATCTSALCLCEDGVSWCYKAVSDKPYYFTLDDSIKLPEVGLTCPGWYTDPVTGQQTNVTGLFDQTFQNTTYIHEEWHRKYISALLDTTYGKLEPWSASYASNCFHTQATALATGNTDLANALTVAKNSYDNNFWKQVDYEPVVGCKIENINGVYTWRSEKWEWGAAAVAYANSINPTFTIGPGDCTCIPDPASLTLAIIGLCSVTILRRRRSLC